MHSTLTQTVVSIAMPDGVQLEADVYRPAGVGTWPALLMRTPYDRRKAETLLYAHPSWYARQGYAVVVQDVRGRFGSSGRFEPWVDEASDGVRTIDWIANQPWCNGRVGMYGFSYPGAAQLLAAAAGHPALRAIVPALAPVGLGEGLLFEGGAFALGFALGWAMDLASSARDRPQRGVDAASAGADAGAGQAYRVRPLRAHPLAGHGSLAPYLLDWLDHERDEGYWRDRALGDQVARIDVPTLFVGGWHDCFITSTLGAYEAAPGDRHGLLVGPWQHYPNLPGAAPRADDPRRIETEQLRWFERYLRDGDTIDAGPAIHWTGTGSWEVGTVWPPPVELAGWYLRSDGRANSLYGDGRLDRDPPAPSEPPDVFVHDPGSPVVVPDANPPGYPVLTPMGPADQADVEASNGVLVYSSPPLDRPIAVAGHPVLTLTATTTAVETDWVATLCDVAPGGVSRNVSRGIVRARGPGGGSIAGATDTWTIRLAPVAHVFATGHRLRLQVTSSAFPVWEPNPGTGHPLGVDALEDLVVATQTVLHDDGARSWLDLPCRTG